MHRWAAFTALLVLGCSADEAIDPGEAAGELRGVRVVADAIYFNGRIETLDPQLRRARALAVSGGRILAVGGQGEVMRLAGQGTRMVNLHGRALLPGWIDPHTHILREWLANGLALDDAQRVVLENGVTTIGELFAGTPFITAMLDFAAQGRLQVRASLYIGLVNGCGDPVNRRYYDEGLLITDPEALLRVPGVKLFADGGSCSEPATTFEFPLPEGPTDGDLFFTPDELTVMVADADARGYQVAIHAIGDRGRDAALEALERTLAGRPNVRHHRIEHATWVRPDQIERYVANDIVATGYIDLTCQFLAGVRPRLTYMPPLAYPWYRPYAEMLAAGVKLSWKGDSSGLPDGGLVFDPIHHLYTLVTRREVADDGSICERPDWYDAVGDVTVPQALHMMTSAGAYALGMESVVGILEPGKLADFIVLSDDPLDISPEDLKDLRVLSTVVGGEPLYCAPGEERLCR